MQRSGKDTVRKGKLVFSDISENNENSQPTPKHLANAPTNVETDEVLRKYVIRATGAQARNYDFAAARPPMKTTTVCESIGHLIKGCLGGGIVSVHEQYKLSGLWFTLIMNIFLGIFLSYVVWILINSSQKLYGKLQIPLLSYPDVAEATVAICPYKPLRKYHKCGRYCVDVTIGIDLFGSCCVYMVVIARTIKQLIETTDKADDTGIRYYILALLVPCILICWILELKYLAPFTIVADVFIVTVAFATIYYGWTESKYSPFDTEAFPVFGKFSDVFMVMGALIFSMEGVGVSMAIENHMTYPKKFYIVLCGAMSVVIVMVCIVGFFGYWGFGVESKSPVTLNFPWSWVTVVLKVFMALMTYVTFALNFWVPFDLCWYYLKKRHDSTKHWLWARIYRTVAVTIICIVALIFPDVSAFIGLIGSFCLSNMGFIYPALIELCVNWDDHGTGAYHWRLLKCMFIVIFGCFLCVIGTISSSIELYNKVYG